MTETRHHAEFPEQASENRRIWDANARWWDDRIGGGNEFQTVLIEPATERLLSIAVMVVRMKSAAARASS